MQPPVSMSLLATPVFLVGFDRGGISHTLKIFGHYWSQDFQHQAIRPVHNTTSRNRACRAALRSSVIVYSTADELFRWAII